MILEKSRFIKRNNSRIHQGKSREFCSFWCKTSWILSTARLSLTGIVIATEDVDDEMKNPSSWETSRGCDLREEGLLGEHDISLSCKCLKFYMRKFVWMEGYKKLEISHLITRIRFHFLRWLRGRWRSMGTNAFCSSRISTNPLKPLTYLRRSEIISLLFKLKYFPFLVLHLNQVWIGNHTFINSTQKIFCFFFRLPLILLFSFSKRNSIGNWLTILPSWKEKTYLLSNATVMNPRSSEFLDVKISWGVGTCSVSTGSSSTA